MFLRLWKALQKWQAFSSLGWYVGEPPSGFDSGGGYLQLVELVFSPPPLLFSRRSDPGD